MPSERAGGALLATHRPPRTALPLGLRRAGRALLWAALIGGGIEMPTAAAEAVVGKPAPPLVLHTLDGRQIATAQLRGQVVVLHFWATWCVPCRIELPALSAYATLHAREGLQVLGPCLDGRENLAAVHAVASKLSFPTGLLGGAWAGDYGRIWRLPATFIIDRSGILVYSSWQDKDSVLTEARLESLVTPLLRKSD